MKINAKETIVLKKLDDTRVPLLKQNQYGRTTLYFDVKYNGKSAKLAVDGDILANRFAKLLEGIELGEDDEIQCTGTINDKGVIPFINVKEYYGDFVRVAKSKPAPEATADKVYVAGYYRKATNK